MCFLRSLTYVIYPPCPLLRLEGVIRGREKFKANSHAGGLTNTEKERKKNYLMIRKGKAVKHKTRMGEKQVGWSAKCA